MKKALLVVAAVGLTYAGVAQDKYVTSALTNYNTKSWDDAKADIDKAAVHPETKGKPKTLFAKGIIYVAMQQVDKYKGTNPYREGAQEMIKLAELKPDYKVDEVNGALMFGAMMYFNDGINAYNDKKYAESIEYMKNAVKIHNLGGGHRFDKFMEGMVAKKMDTMSAAAETQMARSAYAMGNSEEVIKMINSIKNNPISRTKDNYIILLESYEKYNKENANKMAAEELAATAEARAAYPDDPNIKNMEMNTLMKNGKTTDLLKKMEDDVAKEPNNADLNFNLGVLYQTLATPKDTKDKKPANAAELMTKADVSLSRAVKLAPENPSYNSALGSVYYQLAYEYNEQMNLITGTSTADNKKYDDLKAKRDAQFNKAMVPYEKAVAVYDARGKVEGNDQDIYHQTLDCLKQIYSILNKTDKAKEIAEKLQKAGW